MRLLRWLKRLRVRWPVYVLPRETSLIGMTMLINGKPLGKISHYNRSTSTITTTYIGPGQTAGNVTDRAL